jgi:hypothetical protein
VIDEMAALQVDARTFNWRNDATASAANAISIVMGKHYLF